MRTGQSFTLRNLKLRKHHNFREYWVCGTCGQRKRSRNPKDRNRNRCKRCGSKRPHRIRIKHRERGDGDRAHADSRKSNIMVSAAAKARAAIGYGTRTFPASRPARDLLDAATVYEDNPKGGRWLVQAFIYGDRHMGESDREMCLTAFVGEVADYMSERKMMQIRISDDMHKWLKMYAAQNSTTMTEVVLRYLRLLRNRAEKSVKVDQI